ncbi:hypothetical protein B0T17DRAFT_487214 [Bombardia bombarda]|uniref:Pyridoxamine 5'-phosphate oxidase Alr4036 family FMN-binding domain-containing protein n=1 Tax=Bombardia bombarda TaxID=252184 RepID=A0AA39XB02_9PEZI|nr:hypothetical protein B0T17DRAFT_487214 [Bombardia bombarda]
MAPTNTNDSQPTPAPWRDTFLNHISSMPQPTFVLSTLHHNTSSTQSQNTQQQTQTQPRARTCVYRGLWATLPPNKHNPAPLNPPVYESDMPVFTTDARMDKLADLITDGSGSGGGGGGGGGGGPVEAVWWAAEDGTQWRVRGTAWVLGGPDSDDQAARDVLQARMWRTATQPPASSDAEKSDEWSWSREVTAHFGNMSPAMRGTFRNPPPGTPVALGKGGNGGGGGELGLGQTVEDLHDVVARRNFRVVVIVPDEVDQTDLSDPKRPRRWLYFYRGKSYKAGLPGGELIGEWERVEVWP